jgi:UDP-N-acetylmuramoyl-tripeptide--D-alanyl-D-alanine ligase
VITVRFGEIAAALGGRVLSGDPERPVFSLSTDTRKLNSGDLYVPLKGERFDGHRFIDEALAAGAAGFLTERPDDRIGERSLGSSVLALAVDDTTVALGRLASLVRSRLSAQVIGITGSTGKTSTKDILAALCGRSYRTLASAKNNNNELGVPLTITEAELETEVLVIEMGMRGLGQIAALAAVAQPRIGIITNVGLTHLELLGSEAKIAEAKSELLKALPTSGYAILNRDDRWLTYLTEQTSARPVTFGFDPRANVSAAEISYDEWARPSWRLVIDQKPGPLVRLSVPGRHNISNALAAIAAARLIGVSDADIIDGLDQVKLTDMRLVFLRAPGGFTVINDAYNANPTSMAGALDTLMKTRQGGRRIAVLGQMAELGRASLEAHARLGLEAAGLRVDLLVAVGGEGPRRIAESAVKAGLPRRAVVHWATNDEAADWLKGQAAPDDVVLVKGSRAAGLEAVVEKLIGES